MSQKDNFGSGFVLGSIVGGVLGGLLGTILASRYEKTAVNQETEAIREGEPPLKFTSEESMEVARYSLEDKIAQLNLAIDQVREQLDSVDNNSVEQD